MPRSIRLVSLLSAYALVAAAMWLSLSPVAEALPVGEHVPADGRDRHTTHPAMRRTHVFNSDPGTKVLTSEELKNEESTNKESTRDSSGESKSVKLTFYWGEVQTEADSGDVILGTCSGKKLASVSE
ncbi:hypothetical protein H4R33_007237, partial [Dimargaris cristalligena]